MSLEILFADWTFFKAAIPEARPKDVPLISIPFLDASVIAVNSNSRQAESTATLGDAANLLI